jgi:hypothetical protein
VPEARAFCFFHRANRSLHAKVLPRRSHWLLVRAKIQFNGVGGLLTHISFTQGADDMSDHEKWISYSHWGMFLTGTKYSK